VYVRLRSIGSFLLVAAVIIFVLLAISVSFDLIDGGYTTSVQPQL
jgi:hypothetical protein